MTFGPQHHRAVDHGLGVDPATFLRPDPGSDLFARDVDADVAEHGVEDRVAELVEIADVVPVGHRRVRVDFLAGRDEVRPDVLAEVVERIRRDALEQLRLDHVDSAVGEIAPGLVATRLLLEPADPRVAVEDDDAVRGRVGDGLHCQRGERARALVMAEERGQVDVVEPVARRDQDRLVAPVLLQLLRAARRSQELGLLRPQDGHVERGSVAEVPLDHLREGMQIDAHLRDVVAAEQVEEVMQDRTVRHRHHRLGKEVGERSEPRSEPGGHHHRLHRRIPSRGCPGLPATRRTAPGARPPR